MPPRLNALLRERSNKRLYRSHVTLKSVTLKELITTALDKDLDLPNTKVSGVVQDNRKATKGSVFVARSGEVSDGHDYAADAVRRGAAAIVGERRLTNLHGLPYIHTEDAKLATAKLAATFWSMPSKDLAVLGVTGTDGKTTTSYMLHHLLSGTYKTALLSTAAIRIGEKNLDLEGHFTTPEAPEVQSLLARFRDAGCTHAVVEASSHGFAQARLAEVGFDIGVWTNLTPEHLDFHKTFENYRDAKQTLMRLAKVSLLNRDDPEFASFAKASKAYKGYGESSESDWRASDIREVGAGLKFTLSVNEQSYDVILPMVGRYNVYNALAALSAAAQTGIEMPTLLERLQTFGGVPGRMQVVQREPFAVVVDFAHTPSALEKALAALRPSTSGRLIVVIGAAGERDPGKRVPLGQVATGHADLAIFTEEDHRSENLAAILAEMSRGARSAGGVETQDYWCVGGRREAIGLAVEMARSGDTVLLAGKGHERSLERGDETLAWDEVGEARAALKTELS